MLGKLLKYDFKAIFKPLIPIFGITLLLSILQRTSTALGETFTILKIPAGFLTAFYVVLLIALPIASFIFSIIKYYNNLAKDEGYLMHTLPVSKGQLVLSKLISATGAMLVTLLVMLVALSITFAGIIHFSDIQVFFEQVFQYVDPLFVIMMLISVFLSYLYQQILCYLSMALGQKHNNHKVMYSIIYGIVIYNVIQVVFTVILFIPGLFNSSFNAMIFENQNPSFDFLNCYLGFTNVITIIVAIALYIATTKILEKHLNLD